MLTSKTNQTWRFSERIKHIPKSFIREILKITAQPDVISFAGGLPNPSSFPVEAIRQSAEKVLRENGRSVLQYAPSEGYLPLRKWIAARYAKKGIDVQPEEILITNGSQQGLDLLGKIFINEGDLVLVEQPSYLGAIQAFSAYQPKFISVPLLDDGVDINALTQFVKNSNAKFFYAIPNFQNPTGLSYSHTTKRNVASIVNDSDTLLIEDDPYGEIKFNTAENDPIKKHLRHNGILLGSFSKIISPGMRLGWVVAAPEIIEKLLIAKQAADLHSNFLSQRVIYQFIQDYDMDKHISGIINIYKEQKEHMISCLKTYMPKEVKYTNPDGGMFIWMILPIHISAYTLLELAAKEKVVFVPGDVFYTDTKFTNTLRLNYSNSNFEEIERGISILSEILKTLL